MKEFFILLVFACLIAFVFEYQDALAGQVLISEEPPSDPGPCLGSGNNGICADDFVVLSSSTTITDIHFWMVEKPGPFDGDVGFSFYVDDNGSPGSPVAGASGKGVDVQTESFASDAGVCFLDECFKVSMNLPFEVILSSGTHWIGIDNVNSQWQLLADNDDSGTVAVSFDAGQSFFTFSPLDFPIVLTGEQSGGGTDGQTVGGEYLTLDTISLLVAGLQTNLVWIIPTLMSVGSIVFLLKRKKFGNL